MGLRLRAWVKKTVHGMETDGKEKVLSAVVSKDGHAYSLLGHERTHHYWFPLKGATVNSASYCQSLDNISP